MVIVQNKIKTMPLMTEFILILSFANNIFIISEGSHKRMFKIHDKGSDGISNFGYKIKYFSRETRTNK